MVDKISVVVTFPGAKLELRNAFDYPERDPQGNPTGRSRRAAAGLFLHVAGGNSINLTGIDVDELCKAYKDLLEKPLAKQIIGELSQ